jgi:hypothetical protein
MNERAMVVPGPEWGWTSAVCGSGPRGSSGDLCVEGLW